MGWGVRCLLAWLLSTGLGACSSTPEDSEAGVSTGALVFRSRDADVSGYQAPAFAALGAAVADGEDEMARAILDRILARSPEGEARERALAYDRILRGRALVRAVDLSLRLEELPRDAGHQRLVLDAVQRTEDVLRLALLPGTLEHRRSGVDALGVQHTELETRTADRLDEVVLLPGEVRSIPLGRFPVRLDGVIALRERWRLLLRSGEIFLGEQGFPAAHVPVTPLEVDRLSGQLDPEPTTAEDLLALLDAGEEVALLDFLALAVRVDPEMRGDVLAEVLPSASRWVSDSRERYESLEPALLWLAGEGALGGDGLEDWVQGESVRTLPEDPDSGLDLPGARRD